MPVVAARNLELAQRRRWGFQHGSLLAYEIELERERKGGGGNPWKLVDAVMEDPARLDGPMAELLSPSLRKGWKRLAGERRATRS